ncbi:hypothetical protein WICPIJ_005400 [Wickerhamomyces pijperi]|uniref:NADP-dependent oxidoreductase domain-containing protein n=1 Tax=Wickerhamomyces pijperi TaxID=599730 RepID=A0A9P8Q401_WICPI|nr:hypothetical protein WICPIJ_005400 [Wickerhamomyces pijperi]
MSLKLAPLIKLNSTYSIPSIGLGTWLLPKSPSATSKFIQDALNLGYRHIDTAIYYHNEREIAQGIRDWIDEDPLNHKREDVFYTTKLWDFDSYEDTYVEFDKAYDAIKDTIGYIDLLLLHHPNVGPSGRIDAWKAMQEFVKSGKVKSIGISSWSERHIDQLLKWEGLTIKPAVNQIELSPWCMRAALTKHYKELGIVLEAYSPLAHGGRLRDADVLRIAQKYGKSPAQVLIKWSLQKGFVPLPKSKSLERLRDNLDVFDFELTKDDIAVLDHPEEHDNTDWECTNNP